MANTAPPVYFVPRIRQNLLSIANSKKEEVRLVERAKIVLLAETGLPNVHIAEKLKVSVDTTSKWRSRFAAQLEELNQIGKQGTDAELKQALKAALSDAPRSGRPPATETRQSQS